MQTWPKVSNSCTNGLILYKSETAYSGSQKTITIHRNRSTFRDVKWKCGEKVECDVYVVLFAFAQGYHMYITVISHLFTLRTHSKCTADLFWLHSSLKIESENLCPEPTIVCIQSLEKVNMTIKTLSAFKCTQFIACENLAWFQ